MSHIRDIYTDQTFPVDGDRVVLSAFYREFYTLHAPLIPVKILDLDNSNKHPFYGDTAEQDRVFEAEQNQVMVGTVASYEEVVQDEQLVVVTSDFVMIHLLFDQTMPEFAEDRFGIMNRSQKVFTASRDLLDDAGIVLTVGSIIFHDGRQYEILTVKDRDASFFAHSNYCFEKIITARNRSVGF